MTCASSGFAPEAPKLDDLPGVVDTDQQPAHRALCRQGHNGGSDGQRHAEHLRSIVGTDPGRADSDNHRHHDLGRTELSGRPDLDDERDDDRDPEIKAAKRGWILHGASCA